MSGCLVSGVSFVKSTISLQFQPRAEVPHTVDLYIFVLQFFRVSSSPQSLIVPALGHQLSHPTPSRAHPPAAAYLPASPPPAANPPNGMKLIAGSPGTWSGMALRVSQFVFALASICAMVTAFGYSNYSAFFYMNFTMMLQLFWSLGLACVDIFSIRNKKDLHVREIVGLIVFGDWILAVFAFSGVSASTSVMILFVKDMNFCRVYWRLACGQFKLSIVLAFIVWLLDAASSFSGFWLFVSFH